MESYYVYVLYDVMNNKPLVLSDDYFSISDYKEDSGLIDDMGFRIDSYDYNNVDFEKKTWLDCIKRIEYVR